MSAENNHFIDTGEPDKTDQPNPLLVQAVKALARAFQNMSMYAPGHPMVWDAVEQAAQSFAQVLVSRNKLVVSVTRDQLIFDDINISESSNELQGLALLLHNLDIAAFEIRAGLTIDDLVKLLQVLAQARKQRFEGAQLVDAIAAYSIDKIGVYTIDYSTLSFADGTNQNRDDEHTPDNIWAKMTRILTDADAIPTYGDLQHLANEIAGHIYQYEGSGVQVMRKKMHQVLEDMQDQPLEQQGLIRTRMAQFVTGLNDNLRHDLLHITKPQRRCTLKLITELAPDLPIGDLTDTLRDLDDQDGHNPEEMLRLVNRLINVCHDRPKETPPLKDILQNWGVNPEALQTGYTGQIDELPELFKRRTEGDFNPEDYQLQLDFCPEDKPLPAALTSAELYGDPFHQDKIRCHSAEIATQLLSRHEDDKNHSNLFAYLDSATELMLKYGYAKTVHQAVQEAEIHQQINTYSKDTRLAAQGYLAHLEQPGRINAVIEGAYWQDQLLSDAVDLLRKVSGRALSEVVDYRAQQGWVALQPVFPILQEISSQEIIPLLGKLLDHDQLEIRRAALRIIWEIDERPESIERYLRLALQDQDNRIEIAALQRLAQLKTSPSLNLLDAYISGKITGKLRPLYHCRRAAEGLLNQGPAGKERLCRVLRQFCKSPFNARRAKLIADIVKNQKEEVYIRKTLTLWNFSPARLTCFILKTGKFLLRRSPRDRSRR